MPEEDIHDELMEKLDYGIDLAMLRMLEEKALHGLDIVVCNDDGTIQRIPAKQVLEEMQTHMATRPAALQ